MDTQCHGCGATVDERCTQDCVISDAGVQGWSDAWRWERCSKCECHGHCFDGDLPHTTMACANCGTCEDCADCDGCDQPDQQPETVAAAGVATASTESDEFEEPLDAMADKLEDLKLAVLQAAAFLKLYESLEQCEHSRSRYKAEHRDLAQRASKIELEIARACLELRKELLVRGGLHRGLAEWLSGKYERSVPPVDVGHGPHESS